MTTSRSGPAVIIRWTLAGIAALALLVWWFADEIWAIDEATYAAVESDMRQVVRAGLAYQSEHGGVWPAGVRTLILESGLDAAVMTYPGCDEPAPHFRYVPPVAGPSVGQPILVQNPACTPGHPILVAYADASTARVDGGRADRLWARAGELAAEGRAPASAADWGDLLAR